jgi:hypothetical protein
MHLANAGGMAALPRVAGSGLAEAMPPAAALRVMQAIGFAF